jgi:MOSC domain-containing protein
MTTTRIQRLSVTPIKGLGLHHPDRLSLASHGAEGDREFFLAAEDDSLLSLTRTGAWAHLRAEYSSERRELALFDGDRELCRAPAEPDAHTRVDFYGSRWVPADRVPGPWDELLSELARKQVRLLRGAQPGAGIDTAPVTVLGGASVAGLAERLDSPVDPRRFRMTLDLETSRAHEEDQWSGAVLAGDDVRLRILGPVPRCAAVTRHPDEGNRDLPVVRAIKAYRGLQDTVSGKGVCFGMYAEVIHAGTVRVGEVLTLEPTASR